jgi:Uma2 family endonuclease
MGHPQIESDQLYSYADYLSWPEDERWEIIEGRAYALAAPSREHQRILGEIYLLIGNFLKGKPCEVYMAPFDVVLDPAFLKNEEKRNVVQPDISIICDTYKLTDNGCNGAPDWIIEIASPGTFRKDLNKKLRLYERAGVKEYWVVFPDQKSVMVYLMGNNGTFKVNQFYELKDIIPVETLADFEIDLAVIFPETDNA